MGKKTHNGKPERMDVFDGLVFDLTFFSAQWEELPKFRKTDLSLQELRSLFCKWNDELWAARNMVVQNPGLYSDVSAIDVVARFIEREVR